MKPTTKVWARFKAAGLPEKTEYFEGSANATVLAFAKWLFGEGVRMNSTIELKLARTKEELESRQTKQAEALSEFEELFNQLLVDSEVETTQTLESE